MNEKLALRILQLIESGSSSYYFSLRTEIEKIEEFFDVTHEDFRDTMTALQKNFCLLPLGGEHRDCFRINPERNCIANYTNKHNSQQLLIDLDTKTKSLTAENLLLSTENLRLSNQLIPLQNKELKGRFKWAIIGAIGIYALEHMKEFVEYVLKRFQ